MSEGLRRIFYDNLTGERIIEVGRSAGMVIPTVERDIEIDERLSNRNRETFDVLELPFGAFLRDFVESIGYRVNVESKTLEFSYPNPDDPTEPLVELVPLSTQIDSVKGDTEMALLALTDVYEKQITDNALREEDSMTSMMGLTEAYEMIMMQNDIITQMEERLATLEGV